jgi:SDR family mycofactocin-dependent oxidoreductase
MGKLEGKVAFITGAARGQGRAHALRLAEEGADIIALDLCAQLPEVEYDLSTPDDLAHTVKLVEELGRRIVAGQADVRDEDAVEAVVAEGVASFGRLDIAIANAGLMPITSERAEAMSAWHVAIDVMLTGVLHTIRASVPPMLEAGNGGSIVLTSSTAALRPFSSPQTMTPGLAGYTAAKMGVVALTKFYAAGLAKQGIRVNCIHPTGVNSPMVANEAFFNWVMQHPEMGDALQNALDVPLVECEDIANAAFWLISDEARYVTGIQLPVDAGFNIKV